jgi:hypothetical protein
LQHRTTVSDNKTMNAHILSISPQPSDASHSFNACFVASLVAFAAIGLSVVASLGGIGVASTDVPALYSNHGQTITIGGHSLDLSRMIFIRGAVCPDEDPIARNSSLNRQGCSLADSRIPASVIEIAASGLEAPSFKVEVDTTAGSTEGWVGFNDLRN